MFRVCRLLTEERDILRSESVHFSGSQTRELYLSHFLRANVHISSQDPEYNRETLSSQPELHPRQSRTTPRGPRLHQKPARKVHPCRRTSMSASSKTHRRNSGQLPTSLGSRRCQNELLSRLRQGYVNTISQELAAAYRAHDNQLYKSRNTIVCSLVFELKEATNVRQ